MNSVANVAVSTSTLRKAVSANSFSNEPIAVSAIAIEAVTSSATVGVQRATGISYTQYSCNTASLSPGLQIIAQPQSCAVPTNTPTVTPTQTFTATPLPTCGPGSDYVIVQSTGASIVPGTNDTGNHTDDGVTAINLPFSMTLYGQAYGSVNASSNGNLQFIYANTSNSGSCLPAPNFDATIFGLWAALRTDCTDCGIFTSTSGVEPNRIFNID